MVSYFMMTYLGVLPHKKITICIFLQAADIQNAFSNLYDYMFVLNIFAWLNTMWLLAYLQIKNYNENKVFFIDTGGWSYINTPKRSDDKWHSQLFQDSRNIRIS